MVSAVVGSESVVLTAIAFGSVVVVAVLFGAASAPYGIALGLSPAVVALGVFLGSAGFVCMTVPLVLDRVPPTVGRRVRWAMGMTPRLARVWQLAGSRTPGARAAVAIDRTTTLLDRLGMRGVVLLAPGLGRWMVPAAGVIFRGSRSRLLGWAVVGCAGWAVVLTITFHVLIGLLR